MSNYNNDSIEVTLVRMEGKMDRIHDRLARVDRDYSELARRVDNVQQDIKSLQTANVERVSYSKGTSNALKFIWSAVGALGGSGIIILARIISKGQFK